MPSLLTLKELRSRDLLPQMAEAFLSFKHQDYLAVVAEFCSPVRA